jgi:hypothetical protein
MEVTCYHHAHTLVAIYNFRCWFSVVLGIRDISMDPDADPDTRIHTSDLQIRMRTSEARKHIDPDADSEHSNIYIILQRKKS